MGWSCLSSSYCLYHTTIYTKKTSLGTTASPGGTHLLHQGADRPHHFLPHPLRHGQQDLFLARQQVLGDLVVRLSAGLSQLGPHHPAVFRVPLAPDQSLPDKAVDQTGHGADLEAKMRCQLLHGKRPPGAQGVQEIALRNGDAVAADLVAVAELVLPDEIGEGAVKGYRRAAELRAGFHDGGLRYLHDTNIGMGRPPCQEEKFLARNARRRAGG